MCVCKYVTPRLEQMKKGWKHEEKTEEPNYVSDGYLLHMEKKTCIYYIGST